MSAKPEVLEVVLSRIACPECQGDFSWAINERTFIQDRRVLVCTNNGCKLYGKRWKAPALTLKAE